ncbi:uncharacterized protein V6R79_024027 [Siganus canaliculatus]
MEKPGQSKTVRTVTHQAYRPRCLTGNKYLQQKWDKAYDLHREKVKSAKPTINTSPPNTYGHLALRLKKQKLEEERTTKIQRENNMLLEKISHIMRTTGGVDNRNYYERKSLGKEKRQLELLRITKENQMILFRLSHCSSHYNVRSWHEDWRRTLGMMDRISCYPRQITNQEKVEQDTNKSSKSTAMGVKNNRSAMTQTYRAVKTTRQKDSAVEPLKKHVSPGHPQNPGPHGISETIADKPSQN